MGLGVYRIMCTVKDPKKTRKTNQFRTSKYRLHWWYHKSPSGSGVSNSPLTYFAAV